MKTKLYIIVTLLMISINGMAQEIHSNSLVVLDNQKNEDIVQINKMWNQYLMSAPDSLYDNPCWNRKEKEKYKSYDLIRSEGYMELFRMARTYKMKNLVLSITPIEDNLYDIHSMYYWANWHEYPYVLCTTHVLAFKDEDGKFVLGNWLGYYSRDWKTITRGKITYHYQTCKKDNKKIKKSSEFLAFLEKTFDIHVDHLDVYISSGRKESMRLKGFGYDFGQTAVSDANDVGATTDIDNCIIYSNAKKGEYYQHEMLRFVISQYNYPHHLLSDGLAEYYSDDCMMRGCSFKELFMNLNGFLVEHPEIDLGKFEHVDSGNRTESNYLIGLLLVKMIDERCGFDKLKEALAKVHTNEELIIFLNNALHLKSEEINSVLRNAIAYYSQNAFQFKKWQ